ncbi:predicted protein [Naegleria gruberi]|uniref:Predicted protein n=1 Tax=Naegleria gruberi TaxID=5762 RepID=D2W3E5_NAEGR|nr:uncharacterized protein NAEGRDRAFT_75917 [Naegleria gruberi]EFC36404.1 predicted protein [Naegleria gruberi]|eukprot:XP_002669148.1 predicted protein [Naegleria gruberi strain NEG-M]
MEAAYQHIVKEEHADLLLTHQYIFFSKDFKLVSPIDDSNGVSSNPDEKPYYMLFLLHPQNPMLANIYHSASIKTMKDIGNKTNLETNPLHSWFQQELMAIDKEKESFDEYFYYLKGKKLVSMLKVHDNIFERWSQYSQFKHSSHHFLVYLKVLNPTPHSNENPLDETAETDLFQATPCSMIAFSIKDAFVDGMKHKIAVIGSAWVNQKMRSNNHTKYLTMYMAALLQKRMGVRFGYCNIFEDNMKSIGVGANCGMFVGEQKLTFVGMNVGKELENLSSVREIEDVKDYVVAMKDLYKNDGLLIQDLSCVYMHDSFAGCYVNEKENYSFQLWKCKYTEMKETGEKIPSFMVNNIVSNCNDDNHEGARPLDPSQYSKFISDVNHAIFSKLGNDKVANVIYVTLNDYQFNKFIVDSYGNSNLSFAKLYYVFQDLKILDPKQVKKSPLMKMAQNPKGNYPKLLFTDVRDLTGKPMVWSESINKELISFGQPSLAAKPSFGGFASKL